MELFRFRNLALGCGCFLATLFLSYYLSIQIRIVALALVGVAILFLFLWVICSRSSPSKRALFRLTPALILTALALLVSAVAFDDYELEKFCDEREHRVQAVITGHSYQTEYMGFYSAKLISVDTLEQEQSISLTAFGEPLERGDVIEAKATFYKLKNDPTGFDALSYNLPKGISYGMDTYEYKRIGTEPTPFRDFLEGANQALDSRFRLLKDDTAYGVMSALILGNTSEIKGEINRDFSRIGLSHVLALSGMHIAIIVTIIGAALAPLKMRRLYKELIIISVTLLFVGITGFSPSAIRAGLMVCIAYTLLFFGWEISTLTALFLSTTLICIIDPYSIFSTSLQLSFFAMLGCLVCSKIIHRVKLFRKIRLKFLRYIVFSALSTCFALLYTLPITSITFGSVSAMSIVANITLAPIFSLLIYLAPVYLILSFVPYVGSGLGFVIGKIVNASVNFGSLLSSPDGISMVIINTGMEIGVIISVIFMAAILFIRRRWMLVGVAGACLGAIVFVSSYGAFHIDRNLNTYISVYGAEGNDYIFIEENSTLTVFDITNGSGNSARQGAKLCTRLGHCEIDRYAFTDYASDISSRLKAVASACIVREALVPLPESDEERLTYTELKAQATELNIKLSTYKDKLQAENSEITLVSGYLERSSRRALCISIKNRGTIFTYLSAGSYQLGTQRIEDLVYLSDILVFGTHGPKYKVKYGYRVPYLDKCVFLDGSEAYAQSDFYSQLKPKAVAPFKDKPIRFKIGS